MKIAVLTGVVLCTLMLRPVNADGQSARCDRKTAKRVLFIGNSYTYVNNVPRLVEGIASSLDGPCIQTAMIADGGTTLEYHWTDSVRNAIKAGKWTDVVIQDQSTFGEQWWLNGRPRVGTSGTELIQFASRFAKEIKAAKARPILLAHWADDGAPTRDQQELDYLFGNAARSAGMELSPVGEALQRARTSLRGVTPYFTDGHHLSSEGSYLEALVLYATLSRRSPVGAVRTIEGPAVDFNQGTVFRDSVITLVDIPDPLALALQHVAAAVAAAHPKRSTARPAPLRSEYPEFDTRGDPIVRADIMGRWTGSTNVLPTPGDEPLTVELVLHSPASQMTDSLFLRTPQIQFAGPVELRFDNRVMILTGCVMPHARVGRGGAPTPFTVDIRATLHGGILKGVATMHQPGNLTTPSLDAVGRWEVRK